MGKVVMCVLPLIVVFALLCPASLLAQGTPPAPAATNGSTEDLQKATQNPVASLISVPIQNNSNFGHRSF